MAIGDIFLLRSHFENPSGHGSFGLYFREVAANTTTFDECKDLADGFHTACVAAFRNALSDDWFFAGLTVEKVFGEARPAYEREGKDGGGLAAGVIVGPGLPANNAVMFEVSQETFSTKSNGRLNMPGIPESQSSVGTLASAYVTTQLAQLATFMEQHVNSPADDGVWEPGVISAKVRDVALPAKDWAGAFAPSTNIQPSSIIAIQRRRQTKVKGFSSVA